MTDFERTVRTALADVAGATRETPDLADRLVANVRAGRPVVTPLRRLRRGAPWIMPLLAAAVVLLVAGGVVATGAVIGQHHNHPATQAPSPSRPVAPVPTAPAPTPVRTPAPTPAPKQHSTTHQPKSSPAPSTGKPSGSGSSSRAAIVTQPVPAGFTAVGGYFADPDTGWAIGDGACARSGKTDCPSLIHTTDGGRNWHALGAPSGLVSTHDRASCGDNGDILGPCVNRVFFADRSDGYLWSLHEFYWTTDGGRTWSREPHAPAHTGATELVSVGGRVLRMRPIADCSSGCRGVLQSAPVGSDSWTTVTPGPAGLYTSQLQVLNGAVYFRAGDTADGAGSGIYRSTDAGAHWSHFAAHPCGPDQTTGGTTESPLWSFAVGFDGAVVVHCSSGLRVAAPGSVRFSGDRPLPSPDYDLLAAISARRILVDKASYGTATESLRLAASNDGARTFTTGPRLNNVESLTMVTPQFGFAVRSPAPDASYLVSHDGGQSWSEQAY